MPWKDVGEMLYRIRLVLAVLSLFLSVHASAGLLTAGDEALIVNQHCTSVPGGERPQFISAPDTAEVPPQSTALEDLAASATHLLRSTDAFLLSEEMLDATAFDASQRTIPEPSTATLIGLGICLVAGRRRRSLRENC